MALGEIIAKRRAELGMTQSDLAQKTYVTRQAVSRWERNESSPSVDMIKLLAHILDMPVLELLEMPPQPVCQSCGMIMLEDDDYGHEHNGAHSHDYCKWCYEDGAFSKESRTLEEQIEISAQGLVDNLGYSLEEAVSLMGVALPALRRWQAVQDNEQRFGAEARALYGDDVIDAANRKQLEMDLSEVVDQEKLGNDILALLKELLPSGDVTSPQAQELCVMHAKWLNSHWPDGLYSKEAHLSLAQGYLADKRFIAYYDKACGEGATEFLVKALEQFLS